MRMRFLAPIAVLILAACAATTPPGVPPVPAGGMVTGRLVSQKSDGSGRTPVGGQAIGVFRQPVLPGKVIQNPPPPIATAVTLDDGEFMFHGLAPGHYFITVAGNGPVVYGKWVTLAPGRGASVLLIHCTDCLTPR
jgi:hypothetical protein